LPQRSPGVVTVFQAVLKLRIAMHKYSSPAVNEQPLSASGIGPCFACSGSQACWRWPDEWPLTVYLPTFKIAGSAAATDWVRSFDCSICLLQSSR